jgi:hypothetical protein
MMKRYEKAFSFFVLLSLLIPLFSGCGNTEMEEGIDNSFLSGIPCQPPCWYDLEIGITSYADAVTVITTLPFVNQERIWEEEDSLGSYVKFSCINSGLELCGSLYFDTENTLQSILIRQQRVLNLNETINKVGEPSGYQVDSYHVGCVFRVFWLEEGISSETIVTPDRGNKCDRLRSGEIDERMEIKWLRYSTIQPLAEDLQLWP